MKTIILLCFIWITALQLPAQETEHQFDFNIPSAAFGDERKITVYLPPSYYRNPNDKFTVTYVLDGHFDPFIDLGVKTIEYNTYMYKYTPTIVVGIHAKKRGWEFSAPTGTTDDLEYEGGRAPELQQHFKNEVFPLVDSLFEKTLPFRTIIGHSSGGEFVLYSLFSDEKDLFDAYIAISPGIRSDGEYVFDYAEAKLKAGEQFPKFLYCSSGTVGEREELFGAAVERLDSLLQVYPNHGLIWRKSTFEGMGHWTCVGPSFNAGMVELTRAFRVDEKVFFDFAKNENQTMTEQIESFYKSRQENYGFIEIPKARYLYRIAWEISDKGRNHKALEVYEWGLKQHPNNYTLTKSKAKLQLKMGDKKAALSSFAACLPILETEKEERDEEGYQQQKKYLQKKMAECIE